MKKLIKKIILTGIFAACCMTGVSARGAEEFVDVQTLEILRRDGVIQKYNYRQDDVSLVYVPSSVLSGKMNGIWTNEQEPVFVIENLYLLPKSQIGSGDLQKINVENASRIIRSISSMQGMQYYSNTGKKYKTLYKDAYTIKSENSRTAVADDTAGSADGKVIYAMLNDASFGKNNYMIQYFQRNDEVCALFSNTNSMWVGPVKAVEVENLKIGMVIIDCDTEMMVYLLVESRFPAMSLLENMMYDSFSARLDAIYSWFLSQF